MPKSNLMELRQRLHDLKAEGRETLKALAGLEEKESLTEQEQAEFSALENRADELKAEIEAIEEKIVAEERRLDREASFAPIERPDPRPARSIVSDEPNPAETAGFRDIAEFALAVTRACSPSDGTIDERLSASYRAQPTNFHQETGTSEGYLVPPAFRREIWDVVFEGDDANILTRVDPEPTTSNTVDLLADEDTPWGSSGIVAKWRAEGTQMQPSKLTTKSRTIRLHELYAFVLATDELLEDAPRLANRLTRKAGVAIRWKASDAIIYGTGAGQPLGWFNSDALVSVAKESGQAADTIVKENILKMYSRLLVTPGGRPFWLANRDVVPQLAAITIGDQPAWTSPNAGLREAPAGVLMGYPIVFSEHAKTLGDKGDLHLVDPSGYYAAQKSSGIKFDTSIHLFFDYGMQAFRWTFRFGGQPYLSAPVSPANGANTKSHFVVLNERA